MIDLSVFELALGVGSFSIGVVSRLGVTFFRHWLTSSQKDRIILSEILKICRECDGTPFGIATMLSELKSKLLLIYSRRTRKDILHQINELEAGNTSLNSIIERIELDIQK